MFSKKLLQKVLERRHNIKYKQFSKNKNQLVNHIPR